MHFKSLLLLCLLTFLGQETIVANPTRDGGDDEIIVILEETSPDYSSPPKSPSFIPLGCVYSPALTSLVAIYYQDLGSTSVEIENQTTGEYNQTLVNALAGPMVLPISGSAGQWTIMFTLPSGVQYYGEFDIL